MSYNNPNNLSFGNPNFCFTRVKQGYSPEEVDTVIDTQERKTDTLTRQNDDLMNANSRLTNALNECNVKIQQLAQSTQLVEQERQKEKLRLADVMTTAGRVAEETVADARRKAEKIIADANLVTEQLMREAEADAGAAHKELASLAEIIRATRESNSRHYDRLGEVLQSAIDLFDARQESAHASACVDRAQDTAC